MSHTTAKTLIISALPLFLLPLNARAQSEVTTDIQPDSKLPNNTQVNQNGNIVEITGGTISDNNRNLFHSFESFSVGNGDTASFQGVNSNIQDVFSRVTGSSISDINGTIQMLGSDANLYLINPNGIVFHENASLNLNGSFFATTADSILFEDNVAFSASDPTTPLLTSSIPIGANFRDNPGNIRNLAGNVEQDSLGLSVSSGENITLLGGNVTFDGGQIAVPNGINVEIGGLIAEGTVTIDEDSSLSFPSETTRGDITFTNQSIVASVPFNNSEQASGSININGRNINVQNSLLVAGAAGISEEFDIAEAGDITLNAQEGSIQLSNSRIISESDSNSINNFSEIELIALQGSIFIANDSVISTANSSIEGLAGDIILNANNEIKILNSDLGVLDNPFSTLDPNEIALGNGNNSRIFIGSHPNEEVSPPSRVLIEGIKTENEDNSLSFSTNINTLNLGREDGLAGSIKINAREELRVSGSRINSEINTSRLYIDENNEAENQGDKPDNFSEIELNATEGNISVTQTEINTNNSNNVGLAGDISLDALNKIGITDSTITTTGNNGRIFVGDSTIPSTVTIEGTRTKKDEPDSDTRSLFDFSTELSVLNFRRDNGEAGRIEIQARDEINISGSRLDSNTEIATLNRGNTETQNTNFSTVLLEVAKENSEGEIILNQAEINNTNSNIGFAGNITLNAPDSISIIDSQLLADGRDGRILIGKSEISGQTFSPENVTISNFASLSTTNSYVTDESFQEEIIDAGDISIDVNQDIVVNNNSKISAITSRKGDAGNVTLNAGNNITLGTPPNPNNLDNFILDRTLIQSNVFALAEGDAGNVEISANSLFLYSGSTIETIIANFDEEENFLDQEGNSLTSGIGNAGNIAINVSDSLSLQDGSQFKSDTFGNGNPGTVTIEGRDNRLPIVSFDGNIVINNQSVFSGIFTTASTATGNRETSQENNDGDIFINARSLSLTDVAQIQTSTSGNLDAGDVQITVDESLSLSDGSEIIAITRVDDATGNDATGNAGNITVGVRNENGFVTLDGVAPVDKIILVGGFSSGLFSTTETGSTGEGGSISVNTSDLNVSNSAAISTRSRSSKKGGDIFIDANNLEIKSGGQILAAAFDSGNAGNINVNVTDKILIEGFDKNYEQRQQQIQNLVDSEVISQEDADTAIDTIEPGNSGILANTEAGSIGNGGNIQIGIFQKDENGNFIPNANDEPILDPNRFVSEISLSEEGLISASTLGTGAGGNINITTNNLLQNGGEIRADTQTSGANINLSINNDWRLENESLVSAEVDARENPEPEKASGGNIDINTSNENSELLIFAFSSSPRGNDITASAIGGANGGEIDINNPAGVFGIREREKIGDNLENNALNDFDVSSDSGVEGIVEIDTFEDPSSSLVELPASVGDASDTISQNPCEQGVGSEFLVTGKGGFPANPQNNFSSNDMRVGLVEPVPTENQTATVENGDISSVEEPEVIPAQGWVFNDEGKVILTAHDPTQKGVQRQQDPLTGCPVPQSQAQRDN